MPTTTPSPQEQAFLQAIVEDPRDEAVYLILADWLQEHDDPRRAELLRLHRRLLATCCQPAAHPQRDAWQARLVELLAAGVRPCVPSRRVELGGGVDLLLAWLPPGTFLMGSPAKEVQRNADETRHRVTLTKGFYLGVHPVTQAQWRAVLGKSPSHFKGDDRPVERVTWNDCQMFCRWLSARDGKPYRLPTEAEWEYACRAGTTTPFHFGPTISTEQVNYNGHRAYGKGTKGSFRQETTPVGSFPPNAWGLYDLHGNVSEWCQDWYGANPKSRIQDPQGPVRGEGRVLRGGDWYHDPHRCRAAARHWNGPAGRHRYHFMGCRVVGYLD
jgi:uncharacterized protein (TIGR02996 family)